MNIVIIGPGKDPKRFGTYFSNRATEDGHTIHKFSYRIVPELSDPETIQKEFTEFIAPLDKIDLLLYNSIGGFYPGNEVEYQTGHQVLFDHWKDGIMINAAMPHMFSIAALEKMQDTSRIIFMTSSASYLINRDNYLSLAGYFGTKGVMNQLGRSLAEYNDKKAIVTIFAPHIPYDNEAQAETVMNALYQRALTTTRYDNGKIIEFYPPHAIPTYFNNDGKHEIPRPSE